MNLQFLYFREEMTGRENEIAFEITRILPGSTVQFDGANRLLIVTLPQGADPAAAAESVRMALLAKGVHVNRAADPRVPPINMQNLQRKPRTVRLSVFIISLIAVALAVALTTTFSLVPLLTSGTIGSDSAPSEDYVGKISLIDTIFDQYSIYDNDGQLLLDEMLKAYARATNDDYAVYYTKAEFEELMRENNAQMHGIGVSVIEDPESGCILIVDVTPGSPAETAGILCGDLITHLGTGENRFSVVEVGFATAIESMRGEIGTTLDCTVKRGESELDFPVERAIVQTVSVKGTVSATDPKVGIVRISVFDNQTPKQFKNVMDGLISKGCERFVFDVRNNPGGDLNSVNAILSFFLNEGDLLLTTNMKDGTQTEYKVKVTDLDGDYADCNVTKDDIGIYRQYRTAVLVNGNTASAAELFTAALRDYKLTTVVGTTTFGKGIFQNIISLEQWGYEGALRLTTGYYSSPSGENYHEKGITPHIVENLPESVKSIYLLTESEDNQLQKAIIATQEQE